MINADWNRKAGAGTHATLSPFDMNNLLIAAGPDFRRDFVDEVSTGNIDLAPTILSILRVSTAEKMDGRILSEAMTEGRVQADQTRVLRASRDFKASSWEQYLKVSEVESTLYFDEGNGHSAAH
jgi:hypothetical protein